VGEYLCAGHVRHSIALTESTCIRG